MYVNDVDDVLKEAVSLLKHCSTDYTENLINLIESQGMESKNELCHKQRLLKVLLQ